MNFRSNAIVHIGGYSHIIPVSQLIMYEYFMNALSGVHSGIPTVRIDAPLISEPDYTTCISFINLITKHIYDMSKLRISQYANLHALVAHIGALQLFNLQYKFRLEDLVPIRFDIIPDDTGNKYYIRSLDNETKSSYELCRAKEIINEALPESKRAAFMYQSFISGNNIRVANYVAATGTFIGDMLYEYVQYTGKEGWPASKRDILQYKSEYIDLHRIKNVLIKY